VIVHGHRIELDLSLNEVLIEYYRRGHPEALGVLSR
jgi:hypothetical protein